MILVFRNCSTLCEMDFPSAWNRSHASAVHCWTKTQSKALAVAMAAATGPRKVSRNRSVSGIYNAITCCLCLTHAEGRQIQSVFQLPLSVRIKIIWSGKCDVFSDPGLQVSLQRRLSPCLPAWVGNAAQANHWCRVSSVGSDFRLYWNTYQSLSAQWLI